MAARSPGFRPAKHPLPGPALQVGTGCLQDSHTSQRTTRHHAAGHRAGAWPAGTLADITRRVLCPVDEWEPCPWDKD